MNINFNKNVIFSIVLLIVAGAIINKITPPYVPHVFNVAISKNKINIVDIYQSRDIVSTKNVWIDRIDLTEKNRFRHPKLGDIGYGTDFFVDIEAPFTVKVEGSYVFYIGSDDGFSFSVDGKKVCDWTRDRPLTTDSCHIRLKPGEHKFKLSYFQGFGNSGLIMSYANTSSDSQYLAGQDSKFISF